MGFKVIKETGQSCLIKANHEDPSEDGAQFVSCAQVALKNLWLGITVDLTDRPETLGPILPRLLKLQQVIGAHGKKLSVKGVQGKVDQSLLSRLTEMGIEVQAPVSIPFSAPMMPPPGPAAAVPRVEPASSVISAPGSSSLPPGPVIAARFKDLHGRLTQALKRRHFLENEKKIYSERAKVLAVGKDDWHLNQEQLTKLGELESLLEKMKSERGHLQQLLDQRLGEKKSAEAELAQIVSQVKAEEKKRRDVLDKQLAELNKKQDKLRADYKKKSDARKEKLARAGK